MLTKLECEACREWQKQERTRPAYDTIEVGVTGARGHLWLNRPEKLNPLGPETLGELVDAARGFDEEPTVKVVVLGGRGRAFCSCVRPRRCRRRGADGGRRPPTTLAHDMSRAVTGFVVDGEPGWGAYDTDTRLEMRYDTPSATCPDPGHTVREVFGPLR